MTSRPESESQSKPCSHSGPEAQLVTAVLESVPGIFFLIDRQRRFRRWNRNLEEATGYEHDEIASMSPLDLFSPEVHEGVIAAIEQVFEIGRASLEAPLLTRQGLTRPYSYFGRLVEINGESLVAGMGMDITRLKEAQQAHSRQATQLRHLASHVPGVIYQLRHDVTENRFSLPYASAKLFEVFGVRHEDVAEDAQALFDHIAPEDEARVMRAVEISGRDLSTFQQQFRMIPPGGDLEHAEWVEVESSPERLADGTLIWHGFARLITERRRMEEELTRLAYSDALTGLPNRTMMQLKLEDKIADSALMGCELALLHLDLDNFKDINDIWGHGTGDRLLNELADRLVEVVRAHCEESPAYSVGRLGGDEFLILLDGPAIQPPASRLADALCAAMDSPVSIDDRLLRVTASIGISLFPEDGETAEDLLRHADAALYRAKADGPGSWSLYTPELTAAAMARRYMETELRSAVEHDQIQVALQPIVELISGQVIGYEALARWHHEQDGWIDPEQFIMLAENRGLVAQLGEQVYAKALRAVASQGPQGCTLAINVSPVQLRDPQFVRRLVRLAEAHDLAPERLEVEITERAFMHEFDLTLRQLQSLREQGIRVAVDDFGTGYSSLAYVRQLPIQRIKIDQMFVRGLSASRANMAIVKAIVTLANELNIEVTAEGVQTAAELEQVRSLGCHYAQGWHVGRGQLVAMHR